MAIDQKELEAKEFLQRENVRTMRKDLKRLREADVFKESEKIINAPIRNPLQSKVKIDQPAAVINFPPVPGLKNNFIKKIIPTASQELKQTQQPAKITVDEKKSATEEELQKVFLSRAQTQQALKQTTSVVYDENSLVIEKNKALEEKARWQKRLNPLVEQEKSATEEQKQRIERQRWPIEKELEKIGNKIKDIEDQYKALEGQEKQMSEKIAEGNTIVKEVHSNIELRNQQIEKEKLTHPEAPVQQPQTVKEKFVQSVNSEEEQRRKFLEDIDQWASYHKADEKK